MRAEPGIVLLAVLLAALGCRPGETPLATPAPGPAAAGVMPVVRVGLVVGADSVRVGGTADWLIERVGTGEYVMATAAETRTVRAGPGGSVVIVDDGGEPAGEGAVRVSAAGGGLVIVGDRTYRGTVTLIGGDGGVTAVNTLGLEDYLLGVVPREIGTRPAEEIEAVKAQAVAARTYAIANIGSRGDLGFDYWSTTQDQVYGGAADENAVATRAVRETRGQIVTFDGVPIHAYYSSTCGGRTAAIEESWPGRAPVAYLKSVSDRIPGTDDYYCSPSNRFRWSVTWTRAQLLETLGETLRAYTGNARLAPPGRVITMAMDTNASGRATLQLETDLADYTLRMDSIRWVLHTPAGAPLNSSAIDTLELTRDADGDIEDLTIDGGGWGHAIGMCQFGAIGRARAGQKHDQILRTYYAGTRITDLY